MAQSQKNVVPFWRRLHWNLITAFVIITILPIVLVVVFVLPRALEQTRLHAIEHLEEAVTAKESKIEYWLDDNNHTLDLLLVGNQQTLAMALTSNEAARHQASQLLADAVAIQSFFDDFFVYNVGGQVVAASDPAQLGESLNQQPYFTASLTQSVIQPPYYEASLDNITMLMTRPIRNATGQPVGVLAGRPNMQSLRQIMAEQTGLGETGKTYLIGQDNKQLITLNPFADLTQAYDSEGIRRALQQQNGVGFYDDYRTPPVPVIGVYHWISELQMALLAEIDRAEALTPFIEMCNFTLSIAGLMILAAVVVGWYYARRIAQPMVELTQTATRIAHGNLLHQAKVPKIYEFELLATAFNTMTIQLEDLIDDWEQRYRELQHTQNILKTSEANLAVIFNNTSDIQLLTRLEPDGTFRIAAINRRYIMRAQEFGISISVEDCIDKSLREFALEVMQFDQSVLDFTLKRYRHAAETRQANRYEETYNLPTDTYYSEDWFVPVLIGSKVQYVLWTSHDITEQKKAEHALRESEARYRLMANHASDMIARHALDGAYIYVSPASERLLGYLPAELVGRNPYDLFHPDDIATVTNAHDIALQTSDTVTVSYRIRKKDGTYTWFESTSRSIRDPDTHELVELITVSRDITERKQAQVQQERLVALVENSNDFVGFATLEGQSLYLNEAGQNMVGLESLAEVRQKHVTDFFAPHLLERFPQIMETIALYGYWEGEFQFVHFKTGALIDVYCTTFVVTDPTTGQRDVLANVSRDITAQKKAEQAVRLSLEFELLVVNISTNFVGLSADEVDQGITNALESIARVTGAVRSSVFLYSDDLRTTSNTHEWCADPADSQQAQLQDLSTDKFGWSFLQIKNHGGLVVRQPDDLPPEAHERAWANTHGFRAMLFVAMTSGDKLVGTLGFYGAINQPTYWAEEYIALLKLVANIIINALKRKQTEEQIRASLQEKEVLLKEIHHRVKNNLQIVSSLLDLQAGSIADDAMQAIFKESQNRIKSMALIHEQLYRSSSLAKIDFAKYADSLVGHLLRAHRTDGVTCHLDIPSVWLGIDTAIPCGLIINELVSNAFKHAFPDEQVGEIYLSLRREAQHLTLQVKDNGVGLPADIDFRQTETLGLTLVATLVKQLKGTMTVQRAGGTQFDIVFTTAEIAD